MWNDRVVMDWGQSMCGHQETEVHKMTATVTAMPPPCGLYPSTAPPTTVRQPVMTSPAPPPSPPPSPTARADTRTLEWYVMTSSCNERALRDGLGKRGRSRKNYHASILSYYLYFFFLLSLFLSKVLSGP
jgi:hypothetical protein